MQTPHIEIRLPRTGECLRGYVLGRFDPDSVFLFEDEETLTTFRINGPAVQLRELPKAGMKR